MASSIQQAQQLPEDENSSNSNSHVSYNPAIKLQPPTNANIEQRLKQIDQLKYFLGTATNDWDHTHQVRSFGLQTGESISCVFWNDLFHVTGTDIVRCLLYRFHLFGRPVTNLKKFEEGIFSDLRNLKPGMDATLEEPKSEFLEMLYKNNCIRTQKKQKVFFWFSVPHDRLFLDALERDLKKEKMKLEPTSIAIAEPAKSLSLDTTLELFDQLRKSMSLSAVAIAHALDDEFNQQLFTSNPPSPTTTTHNIYAATSSSSIPTTPLTTAASAADYQPCTGREIGHRSTRSLSCIIPAPGSLPSTANSSPVITAGNDPPLASYQQTSYSVDTSPNLVPSRLTDDINEYQQQKIFGQFSLFKGSPSYKQRQRKRALSTLNPINADFVNNLYDFYQALRHNQQRHLEQSCEQPQTEKIYSCVLPQCGRQFKRLEHLKRHFRTHTSERPYSCDMCGKAFSRSDNLAQHKKTHNKSRNGISAPASLGRSNSANSAKKEKYKDQQSPMSNASIVDKLSVLNTNESVDHFDEYERVQESNTAALIHQYQQDDDIILYDTCFIDNLYMPVAEYDMWQNNSPSTVSSLYAQPNQPLSWYSPIDNFSALSSPTFPYKQQ
ncbi:hypothetical protein [Parasitella parasitica]|uniref:C2H2-type domain-containing protein n=1 Tax=Parasitella parasitica TaxID=35722 RepID=A0A0B7NPP3_9FUNG|nr:hypothetical protein [Parasitella parasitica]